MTIDPELQKDIENEKAFLERVGKVESILSKANALGVSSELTLLVKIYNEQLEQLVGLRIDQEIHTYLAISEPNDKTHLDSKRKTDRALSIKRKMIANIREQISILLDAFQEPKDVK